MSRRRTTTAAAIALCALSTFALAGCGAAVSGAAPLSPVRVTGPGGGYTDGGSGPGGGYTDGSGPGGGSTDGGSGPGGPTSGGAPGHGSTAGPATTSPASPAAPAHTYGGIYSGHPAPGITTRPHAVKLPPWHPTKGALSWHGPEGSMASTGTSAVALTFDDGPGPYTSDVLDLLDEYHVKATFCLIGRQIASYRAVVKRMIDDGMTLCNHTWNHDEALGMKSAATIAANLRKVLAAIHKIDPHAPVAYFRHPAGNFTQAAVSVSEQLGMRPLYWTVDTRDWTRPGANAIVKSLTADARPGAILLMHDGGGDRTQTLAALRVMLPKLAATYHLAALSTARTATVTPPRLPTPWPPASPSRSPSPPHRRAASPPRDHVAV